MRRAALCILAVLCAPVAAEAQLSEAANRNAYNYAVRCYAVVPIARQRGMRTDDGRRAFDVAFQLAANLGHSPQQFRDEMGRKVQDELARMHRDAAYLTQTLSDCRRLGFL